MQAQPEIDLSVSASATPSPVLSGGQLTYSISITNSGTLPATGVVLSDQLPSTVTEVSASVSQGQIEPSLQNSSVTASLGTLAPGSSATLTIVVDTELGFVGVITDSASASCNSNQSHSVCA